MAIDRDYPEKKDFLEEAEKEKKELGWGECYEEAKRQTEERKSKEWLKATTNGRKIMCEVPQLTDLDLTGIDTVAIDLETYDPNLKTKGLGAIRKDGFVCGIAIATKKQTLYFPIAHHMTDNLNTKETWNYLNEKVFKNKDLRKVFHNAMYDVCWIRAATGEKLQGQLLDTMIAASVIDETRMRYSLDSLSKDYLQETKYKYDLAAKVLKWSKE